MKKLISESGIEYYITLPEDYIKMPDLKELFTTKEGETILAKETSLLRQGLILIIYNPQTNEFYERYLCYHTDMKNLMRYFNDGNLYINKNDLIWSKEVQITLF